MNVSVSLRNIVAPISFVALALVFAPLVSNAQGEECVFDGSLLEVGVVDESIRCLQQYLNTNGYQLTSEGPGSPGNETNKYGGLTRDAVIKWQQDKGITPAMGIFGPKSQAMYKAEVLKAQVASLEAQKSQQLPVAIVTTPTPQVAGVSTDAKSKAQKEAESQIKNVMKMILDAYDQIDDLRDEDPDESEDLTEEVRDSVNNLFVALKIYFAGDYVMATEEANDLIEDMSGKSVKSGKSDEDADAAADAIEDAEGELNDAWEEIYEAEEDGKRTREAEKYLNKAENLINEARDAFEDEDYDEAMELIDEVFGAIDDALDEL